MGYLKPRRRITIVGSKGFQTNKVISSEVNSGVEIMSDTAEIVIPRRLRVDGETYTIGDETDLFKVGDKVRIEMGYDSQSQEINLTKRYEGFIRRIIPSDNVTIKCEDEMFFCKQVNQQTQYLSPITLVTLQKP